MQNQKVILLCLLGLCFSQFAKVALDAATEEGRLEERYNKIRLTDAENGRKAAAAISTPSIPIAEQGLSDLRAAVQEGDLESARQVAQNLEDSGHGVQYWADMSATLETIRKKSIKENRATSLLAEDVLASSDGDAASSAPLSEHLGSITRIIGESSNKDRMALKDKDQAIDEYIQLRQSMLAKRGIHVSGSQLSPEQLETMQVRQKSIILDIKLFIADAAMNKAELETYYREIDIGTASGGVSWGPEGLTTAESIRAKTAKLREEGDY